jgi:hypothetical protein
VERLLFCLDSGTADCLLRDDGLRRMHSQYVALAASPLPLRHARQRTCHCICAMATHSPPSAFDSPAPRSPWASPARATSMDADWANRAARVLHTQPSRVLHVCDTHYHVRYTSCVTHTTSWARRVLHTQPALTPMGQRASAFESPTSRSPMEKARCVRRTLAHTLDYRHMHQAPENTGTCARKCASVV